ncbi:hypothetical protein MARI151_10088 [Maribacter litoralis]|uniref:Uncharacterized protein n=1 Tax=Maribacter litoralis TaxID=2059726 RepID=A0A653LNU5_9FLAO|nr:hypothetical protein MARI151_10088 [Maribacter litoralis]
MSNDTILTSTFHGYTIKYSTKLNKAIMLRTDNYHVLKSDSISPLYF